MDELQTPPQFFTATILEWKPLLSKDAYKEIINTLATLELLVITPNNGIAENTGRPTRGRDLQEKEIIKIWREPKI